MRRRTAKGRHGENKGARQERKKRVLPMSHQPLFRYEVLGRADGPKSGRHGIGVVGEDVHGFLVNLS